MIAAVYLIPVLACLILKFGFGYEGSWVGYAIVLGVGELVISLLHGLIYGMHISSKEYLGGIIVRIHHEKPWTEEVVRKEVRRDRNGRNYTVERVSHVYHPDYYYFYNSLGSKFVTSAEYYNFVGSLWGIAPRKDVWTGSAIVGGIRYGYHYEFDDIDNDGQMCSDNWLPVTETGLYENRVRQSNSIFKFEKISDDIAIENGLHFYPDIIDYDAPCILAGRFEIDQNVDDLFRKFNGYYAPSVQMRLFILLFPSDRGVEISEMQRAFWQGGNKNEVVVCLGLTDDKEVRWVRTFSWADEQTLEKRIDSWFINNKALNLHDFYDWLVDNYSLWQRKSFSDFKYIYINLPMWKVAIIALSGIIVTTVALIMILSAG